MTRSDAWHRRNIRSNHAHRPRRVPALLWVAGAAAFLVVGYVGLVLWLSQ